MVRVPADAPLGMRQANATNNETARTRRRFTRPPDENVKNEVGETPKGAPPVESTPPLRMRPGEPGRVGLGTGVVRELVLERLARGHAGDRVLPARGRAVEGHLHVLLREARTDVVQDHVARR